MITNTITRAIAEIRRVLVLDGVDHVGLAEEIAAALVRKGLLAEGAGS